MRPALPFLVLLLAECGGHHHDDTVTVHPASPYAYLIFKGADGFNAPTTDASIVVEGATLADGTLTIAPTLEVIAGTPVEGDGRSFELTLPAYTGKKGAKYPMGSAYGNVLTFHDKGDGYDHQWVPSSGTIVDERGDYNTFKIESAVLRPVPGTGSEGTVTVDGTFESPSPD